MQKPVNYDLCIICHKTLKEKIIARKPKLCSLNKLIDAYKEINKNSDLKIEDLFDRLKDITAVVLIEKVQYAALNAIKM